MPGVGVGGGGGTPSILSICDVWGSCTLPTLHIWLSQKGSSGWKGARRSLKMHLPN